MLRAIPSGRFTSDSSRPATNGHHSPANASLARFNHIADRSIRAKTTSQAQFRFEMLKSTYNVWTDAPGTWRIIIS
jgi:hypothetical protein